MKVIYEFNCLPESDDFYDYKIYQYAKQMYSSLLELERYTRDLSKENIDHDKEKIIERLWEIIFDSKIGEIE